MPRKSSPWVKTDVLEHLTATSVGEGRSLHGLRSQAQVAMRRMVLRARAGCRRHPDGDSLLAVVAGALSSDRGASLTSARPAPRVLKQGRAYRRRARHRAKYMEERGPNARLVISKCASVGLVCCSARCVGVMGCRWEALDGEMQFLHGYTSAREGSGGHVAASASPWVACVCDVTRFRNVRADVYARQLCPGPAGGVVAPWAACPSLGRHRSLDAQCMGSAPFKVQLRGWQPQAASRPSIVLCSMVQRACSPSSRQSYHVFRSLFSSSVSVASYGGLVVVGSEVARKK